MISQIVNYFRSLSISGGSLKDPRLSDLFGASAASDAGPAVTPWTALNYSAVYAAVKIISESIGSLPLHLYERLPGGGKRKAPEHPLYQLLHDSPNPEMGAMEWRSASMAHCLLWGNSYSEIVKNLSGQVVEIWPMDPAQVRPTRLGDGALVYDLGGRAVLSRDAVLHVPGLSFDGVSGISPITQARQSIGLAMAIEKFGAGYFGRGARPGGVLTFPGQLSAEARTNLRRSFEDLHSGGANSHRVALLEQGLKWEAIGVPPEDSQFLQSRQFQILEICRWFNLPPHKLKDLANASYASLEQMNVEFLTDCLRPWLVRWEQHLARKLLSTEDRKKFFVEHSVEGILRGDLQSRYTSYSIARNWGWMSVNEIRALENLNPVDGGDVYLTPLNMSAANGPSPDPAAMMVSMQGAMADDPTLIRGSPQVDDGAMLALLGDAGNRLQAIESTAVRRFAKHPGDFLNKIQRFLDEHRTRVVACYLPVLTAFGHQAEIDGHTNRHLEQFAKVWLEFSGTVSAGGLAAAVEDKIKILGGTSHVEN